MNIKHAAVVASFAAVIGCQTTSEEGAVEPDPAAAPAPEPAVEPTPTASKVEALEKSHAALEKVIEQGNAADDFLAKRAEFNKLLAEFSREQESAALKSDELARLTAIRERAATTAVTLDFAGQGDAAPKIAILGEALQIVDEKLVDTTTKEPYVTPAAVAALAADRVVV